MQNDASKASSYVDYVDFDFPAILSIDFAFLLNIMLLEAKKWFVPKCDIGVKSIVFCPGSQR